jgi:hypothetical protein
MGYAGGVSLAFRALHPDSVRSAPARSHSRRADRRAERWLGFALFLALVATLGCATGTGEAEWPPMAKRWYERGDASFRALDMEDAQASLARALEADPKRAEIRLGTADGFSGKEDEKDLYYSFTSFTYPAFQFRVPVYPADQTVSLVFLHPPCNSRRSFFHPCLRLKHFPFPQLNLSSAPGLGYRKQRIQLSY